MHSWITHARKRLSRERQTLGVSPDPASLDQPCGIWLRFVGQLHNKLELKSMKGMSGGPVFGIGEGPDGRAKCWVVAIQSTWDEDRMLAYGCPFSLIVKMIEEALAELDAAIAKALQAEPSEGIKPKTN